MGHYDPHDVTRDIHIRIDSSARFPIRNAQVDRSDVQDGMASEQEIAIVAHMSLDSRSGENVQTGEPRQIVHLVRCCFYPGPTIHFLQADDVGVEIFEHLGDAGRVTAAIPTDPWWMSGNSRHLGNQGLRGIALPGVSVTSDFGIPDLNSESRSPSDCLASSLKKNDHSGE